MLSHFFFLFFFIKPHEILFVKSFFFSFLLSRMKFGNSIWRTFKKFNIMGWLQCFKFSCLIAIFFFTSVGYCTKRANFDGVNNNFAVFSQIRLVNLRNWDQWEMIRTYHPCDSRRSTNKWKVSRAIYNRFIQVQKISNH